MSQAEVPLEQIHAFYWEMGPFTVTPSAISTCKVALQIGSASDSGLESDPSYAS